MVQSDQNLQVRTRTEADIYHTASGRLLTAYLTAKQLDNLIKAIGLPTAQAWPGTQTKEAFEKVLQKIRKEEFVQTLNEKHIVGYAIPLFKNNQVICSLSVFLPESRATPASKEKISKLMRLTADKIKARLNKEDT